MSTLAAPARQTSPHVPSSQRIPKRRMKERLRSIPATQKSRPLFHWDATRDLPPHALEEHREHFPRFQGLAPEITDLPDAGSWAANLAVGICEIMYRQRPVAQIQRWVIPGLYGAFTQAVRAITLPAHKRFPIRVITYRTCAISERIMEVCVILEVHGLRRSISLRLEGHRGRWIATALQVL